MKEEEKEEFIEVGCTALRDPATGDFLPAVPLYIKADECAKASQERLIKDLSQLFALRIKYYIDKCGQAGLEELRKGKKLKCE